MVLAAILHGTGVDFGDYAWFVPGVGVALVVAIVAGSVVGRAFGESRGVGFSIVLSLGVIAAATLTPSRDALLFGATGSGRCDLAAIGLPALHDFRTLNDISLNVALFLPLGLTIGATGPSRRSLVLLVAGMALPVAIEAIQLLATALDRSCQAVDVIDNETGLLVGFGLALAVVLISRLVAPTRSGRGPTGPDQRNAT